ncbi:site-2 protease family protein [Dethiobacter alkaliphilus]|uniref:Peptidase M50 n=1 Tax=Dethiobacter alkaliphilus AHT 1 TaxID=555088 RepID=C0GDZ2_DETAL|nr:site-2 protease family protein [Dethiobacter alkaliphilus]EEG78286.1 peptidase M50 [Dethiobacter alkaliphilus AHT 1]
MPNLLGQFATNDLLLRIPAILIAIVLHELAHGYVAYRLGDDTAKLHGRLTLNPIKHIDPLGLLALVLFRFGWAKPVPVNPMNFRGDRRRGMFLVGLAGPVTNFILALLSALLIVTLPFQLGGLGLALMQQVLFYNVILGVFNLLPLPPLDGSKVFSYFLPAQTAYQFSRLEQYGPLVLILLIFTGTLWRILGPLINGAYAVIITIVSLLTGGF